MHCQIFDVEDGTEQASGAEDDPDRVLVGPPHVNSLERGLSRRSSRPSTRSLRPRRPPSPKEHEPDHHLQPALPRTHSPQRNSHYLHAISTPIALRRRLNSSIHKHDVAQSPLAQVFRPIVLDDALVPEDTVSDSASGGGGSAFLPQSQLSYGPATRRRLTSMQSLNRRPSESWATKPAASGRPAYPSLDTRAETLTGPFSTSPDYRQGEERGIATAEEVEEIVEGNGGMNECMKRLERIEGQQERIEGLLIQLHARLQR